MLADKKIILGVTGGIAAYKAAEGVREMVRAKAQVYVIMTRSAQEFITPLTFQTLSGHPVSTDLFSLIEDQAISVRKPVLVKISSGQDFYSQYIEVAVVY